MPIGFLNAIVFIHVQLSATECVFQHSEVIAILQNHLTHYDRYPSKENANTTYTLIPKEIIVLG